MLFVTSESSSGFFAFNSLSEPGPINEKKKLTRKTIADFSFLAYSLSERGPINEKKNLPMATLAQNI